MDAIKRHRVVLGGGSAFQRLADVQVDAALECAENEGWPASGLGSGRDARVGDPRRAGGGMRWFFATAAGRSKPGPVARS